MPGNEEGFQVGLTEPRSECAGDTPEARESAYALNSPRGKAHSAGRIQGDGRTLAQQRPRRAVRGT